MIYIVQYDDESISRVAFTNKQAATEWAIIAGGEYKILKLILAENTEEGLELLTKGIS